MPAPKTTILVCPYAQFGNPGTHVGAELLADAVRELLDDARAESRPCRSRSFRKQVTIEEIDLHTPDDYTTWRTKVSTAITRAWDRGEFVLYIGGNHLSVMPLYEAIGQRDLGCVMQFDAHLDVYHHDDCLTTLSHGNFIAHLPEPKPAIVNLGHRDQFLPRDVIDQFFTDSVAAFDFTPDEGLAQATPEGGAVLLDIDWDVLDPAFFPAVNDALPCGLTPVQLWRALRLLWSPRVMGLALSEFDPSRDDRDRSLQLAVWLIEQVLLLRHER